MVAILYFVVLLRSKLHSFSFPKSIETAIKSDLFYPYLDQQKVLGLIKVKLDNIIDKTYIS
jgi:hypothetical protein